MFYTALQNKRAEAVYSCFFSFAQHSIIKYCMFITFRFVSY